MQPCQQLGVSCSNVERETVPFLLGPKSYLNNVLATVSMPAAPFPTGTVGSALKQILLTVSLFIANL